MIRLALALLKVAYYRHKDGHSLARQGCQAPWVARTRTSPTARDYWSHLHARDGR